MFGLGVPELLLIIFLLLFIGLIFIIGLVIFMVVRKSIQKNTSASFRSQISASSINTKKCPYCAEIIMAEAIKCKHCGSDLSKFP